MTELPTSIFLGFLGGSSIWWIRGGLTWQRFAAIMQIVATIILAEMAVKYGWILT